MMNLLVFFCVSIVSFASAKSFTDTTGHTDDGCDHFRKLHGTTYRWSCERTPFCPKENVDLIMKLHTASELSCDSANSGKICCPNMFLVGKKRTERALYPAGYVIPSLSSFDYYVRQLSTAPQSSEIQRSTVVNPVSRIYSSPSRSNFERFGGNTDDDPVQRTPQNVYVDCKRLDSAHLNDTFTWTCQTGPCKARAQSYFVKKDYRCSRTDDSKICCPEFVKETNINEKAGSQHTGSSVDALLNRQSDQVDKTRDKHIYEQPIVFIRQPLAKPVTTLIKANPLANRVVRPTTSNGSTSPELKEKRFSKFDHDLLSVLLKDNPDENVVISPASVKVLLALLAEGSSGETSDEILHALQLKTTTTTGAGQQNTASLRKLQTVLRANSSTINLQSRSRIYVANDVSVREEYENVVKQFYNADIQNLDFSDPEKASNVINAWVNNVTRGLIPTLVEKKDFLETMKLYLLNYVYLKAKWDVEFNSASTSTGCFYRRSSQPDVCEKVKFMFTKRILNYTDSEAYQTEVFEIPLKDPRYTVVFMLPHENVSVHQVVKNLDRQDLYQLFSGFEEISIKLKVPRTTVELSTNLVQTLQQLNIKSVFGARANLDKMLKSHAPLSVNNIVHKARVEINEQGAQAAGVTGGGVQVLSLDLDMKINVNRPFLFFIRDTTVAGFLFEGAVFSPDKADA